MPGMDGYEAARRLCAKYPERAFQLIALTGWGQDDVRRRTREGGFDQHLVKPVGVAALKAVIAGEPPAPHKRPSSMDTVEPHRLHRHRTSAP